MATLLKVLNNLADIKSAGGVALRVRTQAQPAAAPKARSCMARTRGLRRGSSSEEPDAGKLQVRICGGGGGRPLPLPDRFDPFGHPKLAEIPGGRLDSSVPSQAQVRSRKLVIMALRFFPLRRLYGRIK
jgi:hypothetical protein